MFKPKVFLFTLFLLLNLFKPVNLVYSQENEFDPATCEQLLEWIYKDLTLKNLDRSMLRTKKKLMAAMISSLENNKTGQLKNKLELVKLWKTMNEVDPEFEQYLKENKPYEKFNRYGFLSQLFGGVDPDDIETYSFFNSIKAWKDLQDKHPDYFYNLPKELLLDDWDLVTSGLVDKIGTIQYKDEEEMIRLKDLSKNLKSIAQNKDKKIANYNPNLKKLANDLNIIHQDLINNINAIYTQNFNEYSDICSQEDFDAIINKDNENHVCPLPNSSGNLSLNIQQKLKELAQIIPNKDFNSVYKPEKPLVLNSTSPTNESQSAVDLICPIKIDYMTIKQPTRAATYSMRDTQMIDTIVIHHTGPGSTLGTNVENIHTQHVDRSTEGDPWYMVGYNFLLNMGGNGSSLEKPNIVVGRDISFRGAHAGGNTLPLSMNQIENLFNSYQYYNCRENVENTQLNPKKIQTKTICEEPTSNTGSSADDYTCGALASNIASLNTDGSISGNMTTVGIAVMGNFIKEKAKTFMGQEIYSHTTVNIKEVQKTLIPKLVELINALKKDHPTIKRIVPHSYFKSTECPGNVKDILSTVAAKTGLQLALTKTQEIQANGSPNQNDKNYKAYLAIVNKIVSYNKDIISYQTQVTENLIDIEKGKLSKVQIEKLRVQNEKNYGLINDLRKNKLPSLIKEKNKLVQR